MKFIDFTQVGGYRLKQATLSRMQIAYFEVLKSFIGHLNIPDVGNFIISGCQVVGPAITSGIMYIDGELCPFTSVIGDDTTKIIKSVLTENLPFKSGSNFPVFRTTTAIVDVAGTQLVDFITVPKVPELVNPTIGWDDIEDIPDNIVLDPNVGTANPLLLTRIIELEKKNAVFQAGGGMVLWNKPLGAIPAGWQEVVNWRGRMPVGMDITVDGVGAFVNPEFSPLTGGLILDPGRTGGNKKHTLTNAELPTDVVKPYVADEQGHGPETPTLRSIGITPIGLGQAFDIMNPFRTVLFIEYVG